MDARRSFRDELYAAADDFDAARAVRLPSSWVGTGDSTVSCYSAIRTGRLRFTSIKPAVTLSGDRLILVMMAAVRRLTDGSGEQLAADDAAMCVLQTVGMDGHVPVAESLGIDRWPMSRLVQAHGADALVSEFAQMVYAVAARMIAHGLDEHVLPATAEGRRAER